MDHGRERTRFWRRHHYEHRPSNSGLIFLAVVCVFVLFVLLFGFSGGFGTFLVVVFACAALVCAAVAVVKIVRMRFGRRKTTD
jgi:uncharacterized membrane protein YccC